MALDALSRHSSLHLLLDQSFVGSMLVNDNDAVIGLRDYIGSVQLTARSAKRAALRAKIGHDLPVISGAYVKDSAEGFTNPEGFKYVNKCVT